MVILLVDDDTEILEITKLTLEGYETHTASTGGEAIKRARELKPDLILLDVNIPDPNGYEVCKQIKEQSDYIVKIIFISGSGEVENRIKGYNSGADDYIVKPFDPDELVAKIEVYNRIIEIEKGLKAKNDQFKNLALKMSQQASLKESENLNLKKLTNVRQYTDEIAHSLQNSMIAIRGYSSVLQHKHKEDYLFTKIVGAIDSVEELLRTTLLYKFDNQKSVFSINQLINDEIRFLNLNPNFKNNIKVYLQLGKVPDVSGVRSDLSQAFHTIFAVIFETSRRLFKPIVTVKTKFDKDKNMLTVDVKQADANGPFQRENRIEEQKEFDYIKNVLTTNGGEFRVDSRENENYAFTLTYPAHREESLEKAV